MTQTKRNTQQTTPLTQGTQTLNPVIDLENRFFVSEWQKAIMGISDTLKAITIDNKPVFSSQWPRGFYNAGNASGIVEFSFQDKPYTVYLSDYNLFRSEVSSIENAANSRTGNKDSGKIAEDTIKSLATMSHPETAIYPIAHLIFKTALGNAAGPHFSLTGKPSGIINNDGTTRLFFLGGMLKGLPSLKIKTMQASLFSSSGETVIFPLLDSHVTYIQQMAVFTFDKLSECKIEKRVKPQTSTPSKNAPTVKITALKF